VDRIIISEFRYTPLYSKIPIEKLKSSGLYLLCCV